MQHTSIDVYAYVKCRITVPVERGNPDAAAETEQCLILHRTLLGLSPQVARNMPLDWVEVAETKLGNIGGSGNTKHKEGADRQSMNLRW